jgi:hypothetical protein
MSGVVKRILVPDRVRALPKGGFSWIDRRFVREGFLANLTGPESLLYYFLVSVSDQDGLSYYGDQRTAGLLKLSVDGLERARRGLERKNLICFRSPLYQVLSLPASPGNFTLTDYTVDNDEFTQRKANSGDPQRIGSFLKSFRKPAD